MQAVRLGAHNRTTRAGGAKVFAMLLVATMIASSMGIYAAGMEGSARMLGGTGAIDVLAPSAQASLTSWQLNEQGKVFRVTVAWNNQAAGSYSVHVYLQDGTDTQIASGTAVVNAGQAFQNQSTNVDMQGTLPDPKDIAKVVINIVQTGA